MDSQRLIDRPALLQVLSQILPNMQAALEESDYRLVGTAAALLYGCELPVGDIDFLMRARQHVDAFANALSSYNCLVKPTFIQWSPPPQVAGQYWCRYDVDGVCVEASTVETTTEFDCVEVSGSGPWTQYVDLAVGTHRLPTIRIELRLDTELSRNREWKYVPILNWIARNGCDRNLLIRAMNARGVPIARQRGVLLRLANE